MPNSILTAKKYVPLLDAIYKKAAITSILDGNNDLVREGANAGELIIPKMSMSGMGDYDRNLGYVGGSVSLEWETKKAKYDRGRMFQVDVLDNQETFDVAFGRLAGEFVRTKSIPELDAWRFASYAGVNGISSASGTLSTGADVIAALRTAINGMDEDEASEDDRYLFITPTLRGMIDDLDTYKSKEVLDGFAGVFKVPQSRFYTAIDLYDGHTDGEVNGGYVKASGGKDINFMIVAKSAVIQYNKHTAPKIITPEANQTADAWKYGYRNVSLAEVYDNKVDGIYLHHKA